MLAGGVRARRSGVFDVAIRCRGGKYAHIEISIMLDMETISADFREYAARSIGSLQGGRTDAAAALDRGDPKADQLAQHALPPAHFVELEQLLLVVPVEIDRLRDRVDELRVVDPCEAIRANRVGVLWDSALHELRE
jgi:hypothetical protein